MSRCTFLINKNWQFNLPQCYFFFPPKNNRNSKPKFISCSDWRSLQGSLCLVKNSRWPPYTITNQLHYNKQVLVLKWSVPVGNTELIHANIAIITLFWLFFLIFFSFLKIFKLYSQQAPYLESDFIYMQRNVQRNSVLFYMITLSDYFLFFITSCI